MIKGISNVRRLPREGKIRLGKKITKGNSQYPIQTPYFILEDPRLQRLYGDKPTKLDIMFPVDDVEVIFPQYYKNYGKTGLKCKGDGQTAMFMDHGQMVERTCTPNAKECAGCKPVATLNVLLYKIPGMGTWQVNTSSWNSIVNLNSCINMIQIVTGGKISFIPMHLSLDPHNATITEKGKQFQKQVYVMSLKIDQTMGDFNKKYGFIPDTSPREMHLKALEGKFVTIGERVKEKQEQREQQPAVELEPEDDETYEEITEDEPKDGLITIEQAKKLFAIAGEGHENIVKDVIKSFGYSSTAKIKKFVYEKVYKGIEAATKELENAKKPPRKGKEEDAGETVGEVDLEGQQEEISNPTPKEGKVIMPEDQVHLPWENGEEK